MGAIGTIESLWRYPVKSMRGEELPEMFVGYAGVYGDRLFAFESSASPEGFPFFTGREKSELVLYRPRFRYPERAACPPNWTAAQKLSPSLTPVLANTDDLMLDVETPDGKIFPVNDPGLIEHLRANGRDHQLRLLRSEKAMVDCCPLSLISAQTVRKIAAESGIAVDSRRFRANVYLDLGSTDGFAEDELVGQSLRIGASLVVRILQRDGRCAMITIDPESAARTPAVLKAVAQSHEGMAGVYAAVLAEGIIRKGDRVEKIEG